MSEENLGCESHGEILNELAAFSMWTLTTALFSTMGNSDAAKGIVCAISRSFSMAYMHDSNNSNDLFVFLLL